MQDVYCLSGGRIMKRLLKLSLPILFLVALVACASIDATMQSWVQHSSDDLLQSWGPPSSVFSDQHGGEVWTYAYSRQTAGTIYENRNGGIYYTAPRQYTSVRQFYIDSSGIIYAYRWQGW